MNDLFSGTNYTIRLYDMCIWLVAQKEGIPTSDAKNYTPLELATKAQPIIFDFDFPLFEESYKAPLCINFILHYMMYELGQETYHLWKYNLMSDIRLKIPVYNQLYKSTLEEFNILDNINVTETSTKEISGIQKGDGSTNSTGTTGTNNTSVYSDTPQGLLSGKNYATNATKQDNSVTSTQDGTNTTNTTNEGHETNSVTRKGNDGTTSYAQLISQYRNTLINVDMMLFDDLRDLFMMIF